tara:strand:- start:399 stop:503 length:105 start_codon:yes stop_codon:yes gene_type:complete
MKNNKIINEPGFEAMSIFLIVAVVVIVMAYIGMI